MILQPIVENALLHGLEDVPDGVVEVLARADGEVLKICVSDSGHGIPAELEGEYSCRGEERSRGHLGLYNVDTIIRKHYGAGYGLRLENRKGRAGYDGHGHAAARVQGGIGMLKVLVVEDEELIRRGIVLAVDWAALGCVVVGEASNGEEALEAVERLNPSLIITDLKMPRMDGIEMLRRLRERGNNAYVIILTAYDSFEYAQSALRLGAVDFLLKPFHDGDLEQAVLGVRKRIDGSGGAQPVLSLKKGDKSPLCSRSHGLHRRALR